MTLTIGAGQEEGIRGEAVAAPEASALAVIQLI
jgi:hypothetical protein